MNEIQEPKYKAENGKIVNRQSGEAIPEDEPVFIFRARDRHAAYALRRYLYDLTDLDHHEAVYARVRQFEEWAEENPERMKEPDTLPENRRADSRSRPKPTERIKTMEKPEEKENAEDGSVESSDLFSALTDEQIDAMGHDEIRGLLEKSGMDLAQLDREAAMAKKYFAAKYEAMKLRRIIEELLIVSECADETGYVEGEGFVDIEAVREKARAAIKKSIPENDKTRDSGQS